MAFVPVTPSTPSIPPSPRTRELVNLLNKVLEEYTRTHPGVTKAEIRAAMRMVRSSAGPNTPVLLGVLGVILGLGVAAGLGGLLYFRSGGELEFGPGFPMVVMALIVFLGLVLVAFKARGS